MNRAKLFEQHIKAVFCALIVFLVGDAVGTRIDTTWIGGRWSVPFWVAWRSAIIFGCAGAFRGFAQVNRFGLTVLVTVGASIFWFPSIPTPLHITAFIGVPAAGLIALRLNEDGDGRKLVLAAGGCALAALFVSNNWYTVEFPYASIHNPRATAIHLATCQGQIEDILQERPGWQQFLASSDSEWVTHMHGQAFRLSDHSDLSRLGWKARKPSTVSGAARVKRILGIEILRYSVILAGVIALWFLPTNRQVRKLAAPSLTMVLVALLTQQTLLVLPWFVPDSQLLAELTYLLSFTVGFLVLLRSKFDLKALLKWRGWAIVLAVTAVDQLGTIGITKALQKLGHAEIWTDWAFAVGLFAGPLEYGYELLISLIWAPFFEEFLHRGLIFGALQTRLNPWVAALISSLFFALIHFSSPAASLTLIWGGLVACWLYRRTGSLLPCIVLHSLYNIHATLAVSVYR